MKNTLKAVAAYLFLGYVVWMLLINMALPTALILLLGCSVVAFVIVRKRAAVRKEIVLSDLNHPKVTETTSV